jgi:hypothetical protein
LSELKGTYGVALAFIADSSGLTAVGCANLPG